MTITINGSGDINATGNDIELNPTGTTDVTLAVGGGSVGIGTATPTEKLTVVGDMSVDTNTLYVDSANNRVGVGTASPGEPLDVSGNIRALGANSRVLFGPDGFEAGIKYATDAALQIASRTGEAITFTNGHDGTERARIDSSGNLLVGTTDTTPYNNTTQDDGVVISGSGGWIATSRNDNASGLFNRTGTDGDIATFRKNGTTKGSIGIDDNNLVIDGGVNSGWRFFSTSIRPRQNGALIDNIVDLGGASHRMDDIYATNSVIQTSDANEKQDVAELDEAEKRVATAAKGLIRKYRWIDSVEEKGDDARIHVGIIAQDLKAAFEAEGLDPGRYAMFISSTWWEADETYTDDEGVEQTRTNTYETAEEAPEGAVERTRLGVRYNQLLAFIIGAL